MARRKKTTEKPTETTPEINQTATAEPTQISVMPIDRERIASRAYELYIARGGTHGWDMDDWLAAEAELVGAPRAGDRL